MWDGGFGLWGVLRWLLQWRGRDGARDGLGKGGRGVIELGR